MAPTYTKYTNFTDSNTYSASYTFTFTSHRPAGPYLIATDDEREAWLDAFENEHGKMSASHREALKKAIAGWAVQ